MKKFFLFFVSVVFSVNILASSVTAEEIINKVLESYKNQAIYGIRTVVESGVRNRYRYEEVYRKGSDKLVKVKFPETITWLRNNEGCFVWNNGMLIKSSIPINDLEDLLVNTLSSGTYKIVTFDTIGNNGNNSNFYELKVSNENQNFDFIVSEDKWQIIKIERTIPNLKTVLIYDDIRNIDEKAFSFQIGRYAKGLEETKNQPGVDDASRQYIERAIKLFKAFMINSFSIKDMRATFVTGETYNRHKLVVIIIKHSKELKSSLKDLTNVPKDFNVVSTREGNLELFVMGQESPEVLQNILDSLLSPEQK